MRGLGSPGSPTSPVSAGPGLSAQANRAGTGLTERERDSRLVTSAVSSATTLQTTGDMPGVMNLDSVACARCEDGFEPNAKIVNSNGQLFCVGCFVCAQCFRQFPDGIFYDFEDRKYCEHCFHVLFAPCCSKCGEFIIGRVIKVRDLCLGFS